MIKINSTWLYAISIFLLLKLSGCSSIFGQTKPETAEEISAEKITNLKEKGWHEVRFRISFPKDKDSHSPRWYMDAMLANEVIRPLLNKHRKNIDLWRFHRRSGPNFGHVFSFFFYSSAHTAADIHQAAKHNLLVKELQQKKEVTWLGLDDLGENKKPFIKDTSDANWSLIIQKHWPSYIMGVSQMWLDLVHEINDDQKTIKDKHQRYQKVHNTISKVWQVEARPP